MFLPFTSEGSFPRSRHPARDDAGDVPSPELRLRLPPSSSVFRHTLSPSPLCPAGCRCIPRKKRDIGKEDTPGMRHIPRRSGETPENREIVAAAGKSGSQHRTLPDGDIRVSRGYLRQMRTYGGEIQFLPEPALPPVSEDCKAEMGKRSHKRASSGAVSSLCFHGSFVYLRAESVQSETAV